MSRLGRSGGMRGPDVTLANFFLNKKPSDRPSAFVPLGVLYLAGAVESAGGEAQVIDYQLFETEQPYDPAEICRFLLAAHGDLIGISTMSNMLPFLAFGLRRFRELRPDALVIVGGSGTSALPVEVLHACPEIDGIVSGDGEEAIVALAAAHAGRGSFAEVPGLTLRQDGRITVSNPKPLRPKSIDHLARPARRHLSCGSYAEFPILTARGCPYKCVFCDIAPNGGRRVGRREIPDVVDEIVEIQDLFGITQFGILDDVFSLERRRVEAFCQEILRRGVTIEWGCMCRTDLLDPALMDAMREAGCRRLFLGIESGAKRVRAIAGKGLMVENVERLIAEATGRFRVSPSFILGFPFEEMAEFEQTLMLASYSASLGARPQMSILSPLPSADLTRSGAYEIAFDPTLVSGIAYPRRDETAKDLAGSILSAEISDLIRSDPVVFSAFYHFPAGRVGEKLARARAYGVEV